MAGVEDDLPEVEIGPKDVIDHRSSTCEEIPDLDWIASSPYPGGIVHLTRDETPEGKTPDTYYVNVSNTTPSDDVASYIDKAWGLQTPNIILSVITNNTYRDRWKNQTLIEEFQKGIIQAVNSTHMWIITNGLDQGMTKIIGDAIYQEKQQRDRPIMDMAFNFADLQFVEDQTNLTVIGIVPNINISYKDKMIGKHTGPLRIQNEGGKSKSDIRELNPDHSHFILVNDLAAVDDVEKFRLELEERFLLPVRESKKLKKIMTHVSIEGSDSENEIAAAATTGDVKLVCNTGTPLVGLLLQGGPAQIEHVAGLLKKQIPVIVVKGSGYAADLIAFVIQEVKERKDPDHVESYIKPELLAKLMKCYNKEFKDDEIARNKCRDKILECVDNSFQNGQAFLTVLETQGILSDLTNLNKYILLALFESQSQTQGTKFEDQIQLDLKLTLDWNTCDLALSQIYQKYDWAKIKIPNELFDDALLKPERQEFVGLFLEKKSIMVHKYLHHKKLLYLFNNISNPEFFMTLCLEGVLERALDNAYPLTKQFFIGSHGSELNWLLYKLTNLKRLISTYELSMNSVEKYVTDVAVAERRAINTLVFWAALTNNVKLTKTLWKYTDDPMPVALIVSMIWHNLAKICYRDVDTKMNLKEAAIKFGKLAVQLLDITYKDSPGLAIASLEKKLPDFNNHTVIEIAKISRNKMFIAHSICQKWLSRKWYGNLNIREVDFKAFRLPDWFKIYMSIFLIFPMFIWITFERKRSTKKSRDSEEYDEELMDDEAMLMKPLSSGDKWILSTVTHGVTTVTHGVKYRIDKIISYGRQNLKVPIHLQFYYFWSAPITKFWVSQLFYILYLILFSLSVIIPSCGNLHMDFTVFIWTALYWVELVRMTFVKKKKYLEIRLFWTIAEIFFMGAFVVVFCMVRIVPHFVSYIDYMTTKFVLSLGLLYFYYRTLFVFLRISPVLGPMLISIKRMVRVDFLTWMRLFLIVMVSGGITIQATLYPNYPFTLDAITRAMSRAFFAMFLTKIDDLEGDDTCSFLYSNDSLTHCTGTSNGILSRNASNIPSWSPRDSQFRTCPYSSYGGYFVVIQYLLLTKLILVTLLYALFSATQAKVTQESSDIWKYQKYGVIVDFEERLRLPPPLTVISYFLMFCECFFLELRHCFRQCKKCCRRCRKKGDRADSRRQAKIKRSEDYSYWRSCVKKLVQDEEQEALNNDRAVHQSHAILVLQTEIEKQRAHSKKLFQQIARLERGMTTCQISLESMKHFMEALDTKRSAALAQDINKFHIESRKSPYPNTQIQRFPIFDKYVAWEIPYPSYDPGLYTCPVEEFPEELQNYIDPDLLEFRETVEMSKIDVASLKEYKRSNSKFDPMWNDKITIYVGDVGLELDRTSWITRDGIPFTYELDSSGVPQNPIGRTGLRGRGNLWRWGPNHNVMVIITRWKKVTATDYMSIDGKNVMEFVLVDMQEEGGYLHIPRARDFGNTSVYSEVCKYFQGHVLEEDVSKINKKMKKQNMIDYFAKFSVKTRGPISGFTSQMLYRGYFDDRNNTDNAWNEAEIWNIHYQGETILDEHIKDKDKKWREATSRTKLFGNQDFIVQKAAAIHNAFY